MILVLDNHDSFVFNLDRYLQQLGQPTIVIRSDAISVDSIQRGNFSALVISPGPKAPEQAGCCLQAIRRLKNSLPILGVCLGHQCIAEAFGGQIVSSPKPLHGRSCEINHNNQGLFANLPNPLQVGRYHSLVVQAKSLPPGLVVDATSEEGCIMSLRHESLPIFGVQFHPESILTHCGYELLSNFLAASGLLATV